MQLSGVDSPIVWRVKSMFGLMYSAATQRIVRTVCLPLLLVFGFSGAVQSAELDSSYTQTRHPLVLVHGALGFDRVNFLGFDFLNIDYWPNVAAALVSDGAVVYTLQVSAINTLAVRGEQLMRQLDTLSALTGAQKFNLIGHSMGSPTARYVAAVRSERVASVTSIGGSNDSNQRAATTVAEIAPKACGFNCLSLYALAVLGGILDQKTACTRAQDSHRQSANPELAALARISCDVVNQEIALSGLPFDPRQRSAIVDNAELFNRAYPAGRPAQWCGSTPSAKADNGVYYYSWSGSKIRTNGFDLSDYVLAWLNADAPATGTLSDGLVGRCQSHWGYVIRDDYPMNHFDESNLFFGLTQPFFSVTSLYRQHANRLKLEGL